MEEKKKEKEMTKHTENFFSRIMKVFNTYTYLTSLKYFHSATSYLFIVV